MFTDTAGGACSDRPTLEQLLDQFGPGDTLVVWKLDRLGRSLRHLVDTVTGLADRGVGFRSLQEAIDTATPGGKLVFHVFAPWPGSNATSPASAPAPGCGGSGPAAATASPIGGDSAQAPGAQEMYAYGQYTVAAIAETLGVSHASIYRHLTCARSD